MSTRKQKRHNDDPVNPDYLPDMSQQPVHHQPLRTNEDLNLSVLRRHNPSITAILSLAPYAVVYVFSPATRQWEKSGVEGSLFVCRLAQGSLGEERYSLFVLNRRGLDNFDVPLTDGENVELTEEYVILKTDSNPELDTGGIVNSTLANGNANSNGNVSSNSNNNNNNASENNGPAGRPPGRSRKNDIRIYGLWIYSEPPPNSTAETRALNAHVIRESAVHAGESMKHARERQEAARQNGLHLAAAAAASTAGPVDEVHAGVGVPMGRQISLKDLFGQQRAQDDEWSVKVHSIAPGEMQHPSAGFQQPPPPPPPQQDVLGDLFRRAGFAYQGGQGYYS